MESELNELLKKHGYTDGVLILAKVAEGCDDPVLLESSVQTNVKGSAKGYVLDLLESARSHVKRNC